MIALCAWDLPPVSGFTLKAISVWARNQLAPGSAVFSDALACFGAVTEIGCSHHSTVIAGWKEVPEFRWINTILGNLKTSLSGCYHTFNFSKVCCSLSRCFLLSIQPSFWSLLAVRTTTHCRRFGYSTTLAFHSGYWCSLLIRKRNALAASIVW